MGVGVRHLPCEASACPSEDRSGAILLALHNPAIRLWPTPRCTRGPEPAGSGPRAHCLAQPPRHVHNTFL